MQFTTLFFDLDDTLYPSKAGLWVLIRERMGNYMHERLGIPWEDVHRLRRIYLESYGTTLRGLQHFYSVDVDDYLAYVHDVPLQDHLQPAPELRPLLLSLPQTRWIFTNADSNHARRVLAALELEGCFHGIIDIRALEFQCKPDRAAFVRGLELAGESHPERCVFLDDAPRNLIPARQMGFKTVLVNEQSDTEAAEVIIPRLQDLRQAMPELWLDARSNSWVQDVDDAI